MKNKKQLLNRLDYVILGIVLCVIIMLAFVIFQLGKLSAVIDFMIELPEWCGMLNATE